MKGQKLVSNILYLALVLLLIGLVRNSSFVIFMVVILGLIGFILLNKNKKSKNREELPALTKEKENHYRKVGMTEAEIDFFRQTMAAAKKQIFELDQNMNQVAKLKAINLRHDTLTAAKGIFKELVKEPQKLHQADRFLYTHLPNLLDLTKKYIEINDHEIKNKQTYEALDKSAEVINEVSQQITEDYARFVADDLEDLDIEISIAKQSITRDNEESNLKE